MKKTNKRIKDLRKLTAVFVMYSLKVVYTTLVVFVVFKILSV